MADNYTRLSDTLASTEGEVYITIDGETRKLFEVSKVEATLELTIQSKRMLGHRMTQHKVVGAEGTGSMTVYFMNSQFMKMAIDYIKKGSMSNIKLQIRNYDSASTVGTQDVVLSNIVFGSLPVATLDDSSEDPITVDMDFTFDDVDCLEAFALPDNFR